MIHISILILLILLSYLLAALVSFPAPYFTALAMLAIIGICILAYEMSFIVRPQAGRLLTKYINWTVIVVVSLAAVYLIWSGVLLNNGYALSLSNRSSQVIDQIEIEFEVEGGDRPMICNYGRLASGQNLECTYSFPLNLVRYSYSRGGNKHEMIMKMPLSDGLPLNLRFMQDGMAQCSFE